MYVTALFSRVKNVEGGTGGIFFLPGKFLEEFFHRKKIERVEVRIDDGRHVSAEQRRKAYATIRDIADYTGYLPEEQKEWLKVEYMMRTGERYFSLATCSMDTAKAFIDTILDFAIENGIPLSDSPIYRAEDIDRYLYSCLKNRRCAVCGRAGEIHHVDAIGMGKDRRHTDDSRNRKMCLCRDHHTQAHQMGNDAFCKLYKVYGILYTESDVSEKSFT